MGPGPVLRSWRRRFPDVELDLKEYTSADRMLEVLLGGETDLNVGPRPTRTDEHIEVLGSKEKAILGTAYEFATGQRLDPGDFEGGKSGAVAVLGKLGFTVQHKQQPAS